MGESMKEDVAHTKGPWEFRVLGRTNYVVGTPNERNQQKILFEGKRELCGGRVNVGANMRLTAKAPEMYDLLGELEEYLESCLSSETGFDEDGADALMAKIKILRER
jgi:hypothetical protein